MAFFVKIHRAYKLTRHNRYAGISRRCKTRRVLNKDRRIVIPSVNDTILYSNIGLIATNNRSNHKAVAIRSTDFNATKCHIPIVYDDCGKSLFTINHDGAIFDGNISPPNVEVTISSDRQFMPAEVDFHFS